MKVRPTRQGEEIRRSKRWGWRQKQQQSLGENIKYPPPSCVHCVAFWGEDRIGIGIIIRIGIGGVGVTQRGGQYLPLQVTTKGERKEVLAGEGVIIYVCDLYVVTTYIKCLGKGCLGRETSHTKIQLNHIHGHLDDTSVVLNKGSCPHPRCNQCNIFINFSSQLHCSH